MTLRIVSNNETPLTPKSRWTREQVGKATLILILAAIAGGLWFGSRWFSEPVSAAYLRQQSGSFNKCQQRELAFNIGPITRYVLYKTRYVCDGVESHLATIKDQQDALGNVQ